LRLPTFLVDDVGGESSVKDIMLAVVFTKLVELLN